MRNACSNCLGLKPARNRGQQVDHRLGLGLGHGHGQAVAVQGIGGDAVPALDADWVSVDEGDRLVPDRVEQWKQLTADRSAGAGNEDSHGLLLFAD